MVMLWSALTCSPVFSQGYQVQGPFPEGAGAPAIQAAPRQAYIPPPATGIGQTPFPAASASVTNVPMTAYPQSSWQTSSPYAVMPAQQMPAQSKPKAQPRQQTQMISNVAPMPPQYAPMTGGFSQQPMPYPQFAQPQPKPQVGGGSSVRSEVEALKMNDKIQDSRLDRLESSIGYHPVRLKEPSLQTMRHRVEMGESLWSIADEHDMTVEELKRLNHRTSNVVMPGELLTVPSAGSSSSKKYPAAVVNSSSGSSTQTVHVVQRGEALSQIAAAYKTSTSALQSANKIRNPNLIAPGQKLVIPGRSGAGRVVKTKSTSSQSLANVGVRSTPKVEKPKAKSSSVAIRPSTSQSGTIQNSSRNAPRSVVSYRVEGGDSIEAVARNFNTTPGEIQRINKLPATKLPAIGEEIIVPLPSLVSL